MERILVGLDGSVRSKDVLETAINLARKVGGKLVLFRGVGIPIELPQEAYSMPPAALGDLLEKEAKRYLDGVAITVPPELIAEIRVGIGTPWKAVCVAATETKADLIVIGSHGYEGLDRLIGTTAAKVVNHATCSVLVVRSHALAE
jgi:universal stress protein F